MAAMQKDVAIVSNIRNLARYLIYSYEKQTQTQFGRSEWKLQLLLYFAQRESLALTGKELFDELFKGRRQGPMLPRLSYFFDADYLPFTEEDSKELSIKEQYLLDSIVMQYGKYEGWVLAAVAQREQSWLNSRRGIAPDDDGDKELSREDVRDDAARVRITDHSFDLVLDEMADFHEEVLESAVRADRYIGTIVKTRSPYYDFKIDGIAYKSRPFLIVGAEYDKTPCDFTGFPISKVSASKYLNDDFDLCVKKTEYPHLNLNEETSYIRIHKIQTFHSSQVAVDQIASLEKEYPELYELAKEKYANFSEGLF
jgi:uncharacterized phage-associated protein